MHLFSAIIDFVTIQVIVIKIRNSAFGSKDNIVILQYKYIQMGITKQNALQKSKTNWQL
jgi:hypothetical protein